MNYPKLTKNEFHFFKKLLQKKYRQEEQKFIIEGHHLVEEALKTNLVETIVISNPNDCKIKINFNNIKVATTGQIEALSSTKNPQTIIAICKFIEAKKLNDQVLILNQINDPGNLGTLIRSACAFGFNDIIVQGVDIYNPKVLRASQGAIFNVNIFNIKDLTTYLLELKKQTYQIIGSLLNPQAINYKDLKVENKIALILGNEAQGIEADLINFLDHQVYIPIQFESLNVAAAGAILMATYTKLK